MAPEDLRIRMYNVGFGDAFLVQAPGRMGPWRMLIDCGVHTAGVSEHPMAEVVGQIIEDVSDDAGPRIDVVVATHRHRDHISGFEDRRWADIGVGEVWMPWVEDPDDAQARDIRNRQERAALALTQAFAAMGADGAHQMALNSLANQAAMDTLHNGFAGNPMRRFLPALSGSMRTAVAGFPPRSSVSFLGPTRDERVIRQLEPPSREAYLRFGANGDRLAQTASPFRPDLLVGGSDYRMRYPHLKFLKADEVTLAKIGSDQNPMAVAGQLDKSLNNTSLMFILRLGDRSILFPGDAQWGSWRTVLDDPDRRNMLKQTDVYKVSHHGSHNGTPKSFIEAVLPSHATALMSVHRVKQWAHVPKPELVDALTEHAELVVRSDDPAVAPNVEVHPDGLWSELSVPM